MVYGSIWLLALVKGAGSVAGLEDFDGRVRGFLQDVQVAVEPCGVGGKKPRKMVEKWVSCARCGIENYQMTWLVSCGKKDS